MKLAINVGNLLELIGAIVLVAGVHRLAGTGWALIATAIVVLIAAEINYGENPATGRSVVIRIPLPLKPQPRRWVTEQRQSFDVRRRRARRSVERWQARTVRR